MKPLVLTLLLTLTLPFTSTRAESPNDPMAGAFFPPELIMQSREQIGVTQEQIDTVRPKVEAAQQQSAELRQRLESETAALSALAKQDHVDEPALLAQLDKVLNVERELKKMHMSMLVEIKNALTPDQQKSLRELMKSGGAQHNADLRSRISEKVQRLQAGAQKWQQEGRDPSSIVRAAQEEFKPLIDEGKATEAEAVLDRLLKELDAK